MTVHKLLQKAKELLENHYGSRMTDFILFGSEARGNASHDSDIDILCVLSGTVDISKEQRTIIDITYPLQLKYPDRAINIMPVSSEIYTRRIPLYMEVRKEGVPI